jgi:hypothetical protein
MTTPSSALAYHHAEATTWVNDPHLSITELICDEYRITLRVRDAQSLLWAHDRLGTWKALGYPQVSTFDGAPELADRFVPHAFLAVTGRYFMLDGPNIEMVVTVMTTDPAALDLLHSREANVDLIEAIAALELKEN